MHECVTSGCSFLDSDPTVKCQPSSFSARVISLVPSKSRRLGVGVPVSHRPLRHNLGKFSDISFLTILFTEFLNVASVRCMAARRSCSSSPANFPFLDGTSDQFSANWVGSRFACARKSFGVIPFDGIETCSFVRSNHI